MNELGGWKDLVANEETELKRRALRQNKLRFCPVYLYKEHSEKKGPLEKSNGSISIL